MAGLARFLKTTVLGGVLVLLPVAACAWALVGAFGVVQDVLQPVASLLPAERVGGVAVAQLLVAASLLLLCFALGLLVRTGLGRAVGRALEQGLLGSLPGYRLFRRLASQLSGSPDESLGVPVWVRVGDARQLGFRVEDHPGGEVAVFVPVSPVLTLGTVVVVPGDRVERIHAPFTQVTKCVGEMGVGSAALRPRA